MGKEPTDGVLLTPDINWAIHELHALWPRKQEIINLITAATWIELEGQTFTVPARVAEVLKTIMRLKGLDSHVSHMGYATFENGDLFCYLRNHYADGYANIYIHAGPVECEIVRIDFFKQGKVIPFHA